MSRVWYAAYGSNMSRSRFERYLCGGTPLGAAHAYPGCRDPSGPAHDRPIELDREVAFGGRSRTWGGGVAFLDPDAPGTTKARLYLVSIEQFEDVVAQENWLSCGAVRLDHAALATETDVGSQLTYGLVLNLGSLDGHPVVTVTQHRGATPTAPTAAYLRHIADGLREAHTMSDDDIAGYLSSKRGVAGHFEPGELVAVLQG